MMMLYNVRSSNARMPIRYGARGFFDGGPTRSFSCMTLVLQYYSDFRGLNSLHEAAPSHQHCKEAHFLAAYSTATPPMPTIRHHLSSRLDSKPIHTTQMKAPNRIGVDQQSSRSRVPRANAKGITEANPIALEDLYCEQLTVIIKILGNFSHTFSSLVWIYIFSIVVFSPLTLLLCYITDVFEPFLCTIPHAFQSFISHHWLATVS
ncbi:hypothetical protein DFJ58DRAFT_812527 [Suillus subalutaceus]|uniref:uncharacterized protein n=1 Tax=Suillus subalutaceus TaxID=48586 RepID=UPI001B87E0C9|nr:uncharacterized protein DFJ58DRAFT_812527 [Suillus subalutaceus]KAG1839307.1 hypothetical protein DFJ58DRAFT_812527 [Suillus subalutaceus]